MGIVLIPASVEPVGVATHVLNLVRLLKTANLLDIVICHKEGWLTKQLRKEKLPYYVLNISYKPCRFFHSNYILFKFLRKGKSFKLVHLHGRFPLFVSMLSIVTLKHLRFVVTIHEFRAIKRAGLFGWKEWLETFILRHLIEKISCVSEALREEIVKRIGLRYSNKVVVIRNWIQPLNNYHVLEAETSIVKHCNCLKILAVGRLSKEKGFDILVDAVRILVEGGVKVKCDIFGDGPERTKLLSQINKYKLSNIIQLLGVSDKVRYIMPLYDLLVVPSRMESFGIVVLEAYDAGVPVIASNIPGLNEIVQPGKTGLLFAAEDVESLVEKILYLRNSSELRRLLIMQAKEFVKSYYPNKELLKKYIDFYDL